MLRLQKNVGLFAIALLMSGISFSQSKRLIKDTIVYKTLDSGKELSLLAYKSRNVLAKKRPCIVLLSGGGWNDFSWSQLRDQGGALADLGAAVFVVEYRVFKTHKSAPVDALEDTQDAIKYLRSHSDELKINPEQIIALGISAGGHLAFASGMSNSRELDDLAQYAPNFIVAYSPVIRNDSLGYGYDRVKEDYKWFSPFHVYRDTDVHIPTSLIISGNEDKYIDAAHLEEFVALAAAKEDKVTLQLVNNANHGFRLYYDGIFLHSFPMVISFLRENNIPLHQPFVTKLTTADKKQNLLVYVLLGFLLLAAVFWVILRKAND